MEHRILHPFFLIIGYSQTLKEFLLSGKVSMKCGGKKRLAESSGTTQKIYFIFFCLKSMTYLVLST